MKTSPDPDLAPLLPILHSQLDRCNPNAAIMILVGCDAGPPIQTFINRLSTAQANQLAFALIQHHAQQEQDGTRTDTDHSSSNILDFPNRDLPEDNFPGHSDPTDTE